jgi:hypothetical protein
MVSPVNVAVLGVGSLGKEHARIYAELAAAGHVNFTGVYDLSAETTLSGKGRVRGFHPRGSHRRCGCVEHHVTPTSTHFDLANAAQQGKHVLVEADDGRYRASLNSSDRGRRIASCKSATSSDSIPFSNISNLPLPRRASSKRTACPLIPRAAPTSASCST